MRLHHRPNLTRHFSDFAHQARDQRLSGAAAGDPRHGLRNTPCSASQKLQCKPHYTEACKPRSALREVNSAREHSRLGLRRPEPFCRREWVNQHQRSHFVWTVRRIHAHQQSAERMPNQNVRFRNSSRNQQRLKLGHQPRSHARRISWIAPAEPSTIVSASAGESCDFGAHSSPIQTRSRNTGLEDYRRNSASALHQVPAPAVYVYQPPERWKPPAIPRLADDLVDNSDHQQRDQYYGNDSSYQHAASCWHIRAANVQRRWAAIKN